MISSREGSDRRAIRKALDAAIDAYNEERSGGPDREDAIASVEVRTAKLTKSCRLLDAVARIDGERHYTAVIELCFGATERSIEAYALAVDGDELNDFHDHTHCYDRAADLGLLSRTATQELRGLYDDNRTDSYYGGKRPTENQADSMYALSRSVHQYVTDQIREGGVCVRNT